ncbi:unnamed protein product [Tenebrio molitor]|nr:unnamed protein product [Tenebrio molitor]
MKNLYHQVFGMINYHTQDNAVIVITKATSVLHLINLKKHTQKF